MVIRPKKPFCKHDYEYCGIDYDPNFYGLFYSHKYVCKKCWKTIYCDNIRIEQIDRYNGPLEETTMMDESEQRAYDMLCKEVEKNKIEMRKIVNINEQLNDENRVLWNLVNVQRKRLSENYFD